MVASSPSHLHPVVFLMGPTGAGKSALALTLARWFSGEVISADSRQVYIGMGIGTDKAMPQVRPEPQRRIPSYSRDPSAPPQDDTVQARDEPVLVEGIPHYLIDILTPDQRYSAGEFRDDARRIISDTHRRGKLPIVVGGTGFYTRVLAGDQELPDVPADPGFRAWAEKQSIESLARELRKCASDLAAQVDNLANRRRVIRALEIARARQTSVPPPKSSGQRPAQWRTLKLALVPPPEVLRTRLAERGEQMFQRGFVGEVRRLVEQYGADAPGLQTVGYRQVLIHLQGEKSLEETRAAVLRAHAETARRQRTWLRKEPRLVRIEDPDGAQRVIERFLHE